MTTRMLIVNADDFGLTAGVNRGIVRAHETGIVTSATLMVRGAAAPEAAAYARQRPQLSVGLHVDLAEWAYVDGEWHRCYEVVDVHDADAVAGEVARQVDAFVSLVGRTPTHLDSHQHVHRTDPVRSVLALVGEQLDVAVRDVSPDIRYCGSFYGQDGRGHPVPDAISVDALLRVVEDLPTGITELGCHPGEPDGLDSVYALERGREVETLCDPRVRDAIAANGVVLGSFSSVPVV